MVRDELEEEARGWVRKSSKVGLKEPGFGQRVTESQKAQYTQNRAAVLPSRPAVTCHWLPDHPSTRLSFSCAVVRGRADMTWEVWLPSCSVLNDRRLDVRLGSVCLALGSLELQIFLDSGRHL